MNGIEFIATIPFQQERTGIGRFAHTRAWSSGLAKYGGYPDPGRRPFRSRVAKLS